MSEQLKIGRQLKLKINFNTLDQNALIALSTQPVLYDSFSNLSNELSNSIQEIITTAYHTPKGMSFKAMQEKIKEITNVSDFRAETIARTEAGKVAAAARKNSYVKQPNFNEMKFIWIGPTDYRTTQCSKDIKRKVGKGVTYDELVRIVTEVSAKYFPTWRVDPNALQSHWNSRHIFIRV